MSNDQQHRYSSHKTRQPQGGFPRSGDGYPQQAYETQPLPTKHVSAKDVLKFRDDAFDAYYSNPEYLTLLKNTFNNKVREDVERISAHRLKRKLLGE